LIYYFPILKILFIVNVDWFLYSHRLPIALEAKRKGYEVHIATTITSENTKKSLEAKGLYFHEILFDRRGNNLVKICKVFFKVIFLLLKIKPDILHLITIQPIILGGIAAKFVGIRKVVFAISGLGHAFLSETWITNLRRYFILKLYSFALSIKNRIVIFQNRKDLLLLSKVCSLESNEIYLFDGSGVDLNKFCFTKIPDTTPIVLMASRLLISKGVREFANAAKIITEKDLKIKFQLVGKPDESNPLSISKEEINLWVKDGYIEYLGFKKDLYKIIANSHIVVLPSYYPEGLPKVLCEAAACGRPIITSNKPGCKDAIEDGVTGLLIKAKDANKLANCILSLLDNKKLMLEMSLAGRKRAEQKFNIKNIVDKHMKVYEKLSKMDN